MIKEKDAVSVTALHQNPQQTSTWAGCSFNSDTRELAIRSIRKIAEYRSANAEVTLAPLPERVRIASGQIADMERHATPCHATSRQCHARSVMNSGRLPNKSDLGLGGVA